MLISYKITLMIPIIMLCISSPLIIYMIKILLKKKFMKILLDIQYFQLFKDSMLQLWHMVKQELVKHILWKDLNIIIKILKEESFRDLLKKFLNISKIAVMKVPHLWLELLIYKFIMKIYLIFLDLKDKIC